VDTWRSASAHYRRDKVALGELLHENVKAKIISK